MTKSMTTNGTTMPAATESYTASYAALNSIAERLRTGAAGISVDTLVEDIRAARAAHAVCRARLDAVRREIDAEIAAVDAEEVVEARETAEGVAGEARQTRRA